jgi:hypothetical protein
MAASRLELVVGGAMLVLVGAGLSYMARPKRPPLRALSIEGIHIASEPIARDQTLVREKTWKPAADVYLIGWTYSIGGLGAGPELLLLHDDTVLFFGPKGGAFAGNPAFYAEGAGYKVKAGEAVTLRLTITNQGVAGATHGAQALIYFVPADSN